MIVTMSFIFRLIGRRIVRNGVAEFEAERNQEKAYRAALAKGEADAPGGQEHAEVMRWAKAA
jgi:hypothetical protein